jgi:hypothetical protein
VCTNHPSSSKIASGNSRELHIFRIQFTKQRKMEPNRFIVIEEN